MCFRTAGCQGHWTNVDDGGSWYEIATNVKDGSEYYFKFYSYGKARRRRRLSIAAEQARFELGVPAPPVGVSGENWGVKKPEVDPVVARNRKAAHDYQLGESWEAGIVLQGMEVKALRAGRASLVGGFAIVEDREIWLHGVHIPQYSQAHWFNDGSRRKRKLLLHRAQIDKIERKVNESGLTIVPLTLYFKDGRAKVEIALGRGKKTWDKRHTLAEREASREVERAVSRRLKGRPD